MHLYRVSKILGQAVLYTYFRQRVEGRQNVPKEGGFVVAANHVSYLDPLAIGVALPRRVRFMAKAELFDRPVLGYLMSGCGAFPVQRGVADRQAIRHALQVLKAGGVVGVFPEGTRNRDGEELQPQGGAALIALKAGVPVLPTAIWGTENVDGPLHLPKPVRIGVRFGELMDLPTADRVDRQHLALASQLIMNRVRELQHPS